MGTIETRLSNDPTPNSLNRIAAIRKSSPRGEAPGPQSTLVLPLHGLVVLLIFVELSVLLRCGVLVLLVLGHEVVHVALRLGELHLIHALARVPVQERLAPEHAGELFGKRLNISSH